MADQCKALANTTEFTDTVLFKLPGFEFSTLGSASKDTAFSPDIHFGPLY